MLSSIKKIAVATILVSSLAFSAFADGSKDVVTSTSKNVVRNSFGNCVRTQWNVETDKCTNNGEAKLPSSHSRSYLVFFDFDKSNLRVDAKKILDQALADAKSKRALSFRVTGHTDTVGTVAYNMKLSQKRADSVKAYLMSKGTANNNVGTVAKGKSEPLVPTKDGVREAQNRRAEIVYYYQE